MTNDQKYTQDDASICAECLLPLKVAPTFGTPQNKRVFHANWISPVLVLKPYDKARAG
jgi:hypothetical protein